MDNVILVLISFLASVAFGIVFRIGKKELLLAGLGGALTRLAYIILTALIPTRLVYCLLASVFAALYAEVLAYFRRVPSTLFLYPSIIPLIPGDLLYYLIVGVLLKDTDMVITYGPACVEAVAGICLGFVIVSTVMHYYRRYLVYRARSRAVHEVMAKNS